MSKALATSPNGSTLAPVLPEIHGEIIDCFKNVVFLTREHSPRERGPVYVVRVILGDLYRVRYADDEAGSFAAEGAARIMFHKVARFVQGEDLYNQLLEGPADGSYSAFDL